MRTIKKNSDLDPIVRRLADTPHPSTRQAIFPTLRDLLCFAAILGFEMETRVPIHTQSDTFVDGRVFERDDLSMDLMYLIGLADARDVDVLRDENEEKLASVFEEYANGGLRVLGDWLLEHPEDPSGDKALVAALISKGFLEVGHKSLHEVAAEVTF